LVVEEPVVAAAVLPEPPVVAPLPEPVVVAPLPEPVVVAVLPLPAFVLAVAVAEALEPEDVDAVPLTPRHSANCSENATEEPFAGFKFKQVMHCPQR
jgi:hypothetical protein